MFENGIYIGNEDSVTSFVNLVTDKLVAQLDKDIKAIEKCSNKTMAAKWIVYKDSGNPEQTCVHLSLSSASCWDMELGDAGVPSCDFCWLASEIDCWYEKMRRTVGNQRDPRIDGPSLNWPRLGMDLGNYFIKLRDRKVAQRTDWKKLAYLVRGFLMYASTVRLTEMLVKQLTDHFDGIDLMQQIMDRFGGHKFENYFDVNFDSIVKGVNDLFDKLVDPSLEDYRNVFDQMTRIEGINFNRNDFDDWRHYGQEEFDEYIALHYVNLTEHVGTVFGRLVSTRKNIVFNPIASPFIDNLVYETTDVEMQRLAKLGINVGQKVILPTRRLRNENRLFLWNLLEDWPPCTATEGDRVNHTSVRFRCTTPLPMVTIDQEDITASQNKIKIQVEMI